MNNTKLRNIGFAAHVDAGKTTTTERVLFATKKIHKIGEIDSGTSTMDYLEEERSKGITIRADYTRCEWRDYIINFIDTPGHIDFNIEVERSLRVLDGMIAIFDSSNGVEPQSIKVWEQADKYKVPRACYINKMDKLGADFSFSINDIRKKLSENVYPLHIPIFIKNIYMGFVDIVAMKKIIWPDANSEHIFEVNDLKESDGEWYIQSIKAREDLFDYLSFIDEDFLKQYHSSNIIDEKFLKATIRKAVISRKLFPAVSGTSFKNKGVEHLLDLIIDYMPSPNEVLNIAKQNLSEDALISFVFKTISDTFLGEVSIIRVYSGKISAGKKIYNTRLKKWGKISKIVRFHADDKEFIDSTTSGDIVGINFNLENRTGDTLISEEKDFFLENIDIPDPVVEASIIPATQEDNNKMLSALKYITKEDPTLKVRYDSEISQWILGGVGEFQLEIAISRMKTEKKVNIIMGKPKISLREGITKSVEIEYQHKKQTGGAGQFAILKLRIEPICRIEEISDKKGRFEFVNKIFGGAIPKSYIPEIEAKVKESLNNGPISSSKVINARVILLDGRYHEVDSSTLAFGIATKAAMRELLSKAEAKVLEPIAELIIETPVEFYNKVLGVLMSRSAIIQSVIDLSQGKNKMITSSLPLEKLFGFSNFIRSRTQGMCTIHQYKVSHYKIRTYKNEENQN